MNRFQNYPDLEGELQTMRHRLEKEKHVPPDNTKTAAGGYYDVDFAVSCLRLRHRVPAPPEPTWPPRLTPCVPPAR